MLKMGMINSKKEFAEGEVFCKFCINRIRANKNVLAVTTGATGSGKSLSDLRKAELLYLKQFNQPFPIENCCFSVNELMKRIVNGNLRKGEVLIMEESGVNLGSADWQNKIVKGFNYILQAFRSMNIIVLFNLPVLSMLSKQARQLIHMHMETMGIDKELNKCKIKPLVHQLNQHSGKSYWKFLRVSSNGKVVPIKSIALGLPSEDLRNKYEDKKRNYLYKLTSEFNDELDKMEQKKEKKLDKGNLTKIQYEVNELKEQGKSVKEIADIRKVDISVIYECLRMIKRKKNGQISKGIGVLVTHNPPQPHINEFVGYPEVRPI